MNGLALARWQFAITTVYHFFFVPLTLGLAILVAIMETRYVMTGDETWRRMTKFWGKLFVINFAMGVVTGIVQEFQFGMNWSDYSRFVGDIFGAPLAVEALLAFFLESTFLGMWIFGWERLSKRVHLLAIWLVAISSNISAFWILVANSWMQEPVGYVVRNGRAEMVDFGALLTNPHVWVQWPHVFFSGLATAGFFVLGISAYRLLRVRPVAGRRRGTEQGRGAQAPAAQPEFAGGERKTEGGDYLLRPFIPGRRCNRNHRRSDGRVGGALPGPAHGERAADEDGRGRSVVGHREPGVDVALHHRRHEGTQGRLRHPRA